MRHVPTTEVQFIAIAAEILSVYLASEVKADENVWARLAKFGRTLS